MAIMLLAVIYLSFIALGLPDSLFGVAWPVMHADLGLDEGLAAVYMLIIGLGTASVSFIAGPIIRKLGTGWVTAFSVLLTAAGLAGMSLSMGIITVAASSILMGIGAGAVDTGLNDFVSKHYKARHMSWLHCFWGIGVTVSPLIMSVFLESGGWRSGYRSVFYIQLCLAAVMFMSLPLWRRVSGKGTPPAEAAPEKTKGYRPLKEKGVLFAALSLCIYCGMEYLVGIWGASYLVNVRGFSPADAARHVAIYYGGIMAGRFVTGVLTVKLSNKNLIRGGTALSIIGAIALLLPLRRFAMIGLLLIGTGFAPVFPCTIDSTKSRFDKRFSADIIGFQMGFAYIGAIMFQLIVGFAATRTTFSVLPYVLLICGILLFLDVEYLNRITQKTPPANCV